MVRKMVDRGEKGELSIDGELKEVRRVTRIRKAGKKMRNEEEYYNGWKWCENEVK